MLLVSVLLATAAACGAPDRPAAATAASPMGAEEHATRGKIKEIRDNGVVVIAHDEIPGYMRAMTMAFDVESKKLLDGVAAGDRVAFTFVERDDGRRVIVKLAKLP